MSDSVANGNGSKVPSDGSHASSAEAKDYRSAPLPAGTIVDTEHGSYILAKDYGAYLLDDEGRPVNNDGSPVDDPHINDKPVSVPNGGGATGNAAPADDAGTGNAGDEAAADALDGQPGSTGVKPGGTDDVTNGNAAPGGAPAAGDGKGNGSTAADGNPQKVPGTGATTPGKAAAEPPRTGRLRAWFRRATEALPVLGPRLAKRNKERDERLAEARARVAAGGVEEDITIYDENGDVVSFESLPDELKQQIVKGIKDGRRAAKIAAIGGRVLWALMFVALIAFTSVPSPATVVYSSANDDMSAIIDALDKQLDKDPDTTVTASMDTGADGVGTLKLTAGGKTVLTRRMERGPKPRVVLERTDDGAYLVTISAETDIDGDGRNDGMMSFSKTPSRYTPMRDRVAQPDKGKDDGTGNGGNDKDEGKDDENGFTDGDGLLVPPMDRPRFR